MTNKNISLYFTYDKNGPGKVIVNLQKGLIQLGYDVHMNPSRPVGWISLLQDHPISSNLKRSDALCGPNLFVLPDENYEMCRRFDHFVCPSKWVFDKYRSFPILSHASIDVWPVGIDTETWKNDQISASFKDKVLLYSKGKSEEEVKRASNIILHTGSKVQHIQYGSYSETELKIACENSKCCVLLTGTESQGIAYMQILSCGIPCYVVDTDTWVDSRRNLSFSATSVPYFDDSCGVKVSSLEESTLTQFLENISEYDPRGYIVKNHSLKSSAESYISIMQKYNCRVW